MPCEHCTNPNGEACYPEYGMVPHISFDENGNWIPPATLPRSEWPENFTLDPEDPRMGTYHCPKCGDGKPMQRNWEYPA